MATESGALDLAALAELADRAGRIPQRELHCHRGVRLWLMLTCPELEPQFPSTASIGALTGVPVFEEPDFGPGAWELREDGEVKASGVIDLPPWLLRLLEPVPYSFTPARPVSSLLLDRMTWGAVIPPPVPFTFGSVI